MKYLFVGLLVSFLFLVACSSNDVIEDDVLNNDNLSQDDDLLIEDEPFDDVLDDDEDILPELADVDEYIEIGEMI
ncbi:MAG: hypothetical protein ACLFN8_05020 [Candidatus Woesearchaeota archaeon]